MKEKFLYVWHLFFPKKVKSNLSLWKRIKMSKSSYLLIAPYFILFTLFVCLTKILLYCTIIINYINIIQGRAIWKN